MLLLKPGCECCDRDLPPDSGDALICSFECTFCRDCADTKLDGVCPNCSGNLVERPTRLAKMLAKYPAATERKAERLHCTLRFVRTRRPARSFLVLHAACGAGSSTDAFPLHAKPLNIP